MQKLKSNKGSTLVAVVVFAIVAAIGGAGYMHVMSNTVSHEVDALNDEKAYQTAESGLMIGVRWLINPHNWNNMGTTTILPDYKLNGMTCVVSLEVEDGKPTIYSKVTHDDLPYTKILSFTPTTLPLTPGTLIDKFPEGCKDEVLTNIIFDGHVHSNEPLKITSADFPSESRVEFKDDVSLYNRNEEGEIIVEMNYKGGKYGEETYRYGVIKEELKEGAQADKLDNVFRGDYDPFQGKLVMPSIPSPDAPEPINLDAYIEEWGRVNPLADTFPNGIPPFLRFLDDGRVTYNYYDHSISLGGQPVAETLTTTTTNNVDLLVDGQIIRTRQTIGVLGKVKGNTTIITDDDYDTDNFPDLDPNTEPSIVILGDLVYHDFTILNDYFYTNYDNTGNYGVGHLDENNSLITLVSDGNIEFGDLDTARIYKKEFDEVGDTLVNLKAPGTELFVTAVLIANNKDYGLRFKPKQDGCEIQKSAYNYTLRHIGSRIIDTWSSYFSTGRDRLFYLYTDSRINDFNFRGPGIPNVIGGVQYGEGGFVYLVDGNWSERNEVPEE